MTNSNKFYSSKQEKLIADALGWKVRAGSGSRPCAVGDIYDDSWLGECKTHKTPGHNIIFNFKVWNKIKDEAASIFKYPALFVDDGSQNLKKTWVMSNHNPMYHSLFKQINEGDKKSFSFNSDDMTKELNNIDMLGLYLTEIKSFIFSFDIFNHELVNITL